MSQKTNLKMSFSAPYVERRKTKKVFLKQVNQIINWEPITRILARYYTKGQSARGRKAYPPLVLFKMCLLQTWYDLSDYGVEEQVNDVLSFMRFCDLQLEDDVPDHSVVCRFRKALNQTASWEVLLQAINEQLTAQGVVVKQGAIIDASITPTPRKPKGTKVYELPQEGEAPLQASPNPGVDREGSWVKKGGKLPYGYKRHYGCDQGAGLLLSVATTPASAHESKHMAQVVKEAHLPSGSPVLSDKGYSSASNEALLPGMGLKSRLQGKAYRNAPLSKWAGRYNKLIGKDRYKIERVFGSISRWFGVLKARYVGLSKTHGQHVLEGIAYNLYRTPGIILSNSLYSM
ncbi:MAG: IS5 family transposase [Bacteroidota bacterium]